MWKINAVSVLPRPKQLVLALPKPVEPRGERGICPPHPRFCKINPIPIRVQIMPTTLLLGPPGFSGLQSDLRSSVDRKKFSVPSTQHIWFFFFLKNFQMENSFNTHWSYICKRRVLKSISCILLSYVPGFCDFQKNFMQS